MSIGLWAFTVQEQEIIQTCCGWSWLQPQTFTGQLDYAGTEGIMRNAVLSLLAAEEAWRGQFA